MNDFSKLDFNELWHGRDRVTEVESRIILSLMEDEGTSRVLEIGAGNGRLVNTLSASCSSYFAMDRVERFLHDIRAAGERANVSRICGDINHIPSQDGLFDIVIMVRVFNFLRTVQPVLYEIRRVMKEDGAAVISYFHSRSIASLLDLICAGDKDRNTACLQSGRGIRRVLRSNFEEYFYSRGYFNEIVRDAGFEVVDERVCGLEDYLPFRRLPADAFVSISKIAAPFTLIPHSFVKMRRA